VTYSHHSLIKGDRKAGLYALVMTVFLAVVFTCLQGLEYNVASFTISDGTYTSCFFFGTGFHGFHVIIGTVFL
jgi:cytochrome c oxidase subunit 3